MLDAEVLELAVPARTDQVAGVRHAVAEHLERHGVASVVIDDVELVVSELLTNAIVHPRRQRAPVEVFVHIDDAVVVAVTNVGRAVAIPPIDAWVVAPPDASYGRGLGIVRRLTDAVAVEESDGRTAVSCRRRLPGSGVR